MARRVFRLNRKGVSKILRSDEFGARMNVLAREIADQIGEEAYVREYSTDRRKAAVWVPPELQARDGALTRAAAAAGLEVRTK